MINARDIQFKLHRAHVYMYEYRIYMCMGTYMEEFDDTVGYWTIIPFLVLHVVPLNK